MPRTSSGGGLHQIEPGGFLKTHADFNYHNTLRLDRRINLIVYLNKDRREEYTGHLELWDRDVTRVAGRPGMTRRSLALYYYTNGRPEEEKTEAHGTLWRERPGTLSARRAGLFGGLARLFRRPNKAA